MLNSCESSYVEHQRDSEVLTLRESVHSADEIEIR